MFKLKEIKGSIGWPKVFGFEATWEYEPQNVLVPIGSARNVPIPIGSPLGFQILNKRYGKCLDVHPDYNEPYIYRCNWHYAMNQHWMLLPSDGYVVIVSRLTGKCMDVQDWDLCDGAVVQQWDYHGGINQQWEIEELDDGSYQIRARHSGKCLDMLLNGRADGGAATQWEWHGEDNQRWWIKRAL